MVVVAVVVLVCVDVDVAVDVVVFTINPPVVPLRIDFASLVNVPTQLTTLRTSSLGGSRLMLMIGLILALIPVFERTNSSGSRLYGICFKISTQ